ncbi:hypothetical protein RRG08_028210 [Elysia crispata]|uniref:Uncharacterized protein n=1 Tax=Elysia crispata TaxID=231223 RepID=A0AAE0YBN4_9GAST|nr:hypothetical protein RRG08_028210 [Elysia crispata]
MYWFVPNAESAILKGSLHTILNISSKDFDTNVKLSGLSDHSEWQAKSDVSGQIASSVHYSQSGAPGHCLTTGHCLIAGVGQAFPFIVCLLFYRGPHITQTLTTDTDQRGTRVKESSDQNAVHLNECPEFDSFLSTQLAM